MKKGIELSEARKIIQNNIKDFPAETTGIEAAAGRVLAVDIKAPIDHPPFARSPLDGFALRAVDTKGARADSPLELKIVAKTYAGDEPADKISSGQAVRIMTGAPMPAGADSVIRQEETSWQNDVVKIMKELQPGQNYAPAGEDIKKGELLCKAGTLLRSPQIGVLASMGIAEVKTRPLPRAGVITTGNELKPVGEELTPGKIYNSNNYLFASRLDECGAEVVDSSVVQDEKEKIQAKIASMMPECEIIITTGGVSVGEKDLMLDLLEDMGAEIFFWKIGLKPGTPIICAKIKDKLLFCLSGNPAAAVITFDLLVRPALIAINGFKHVALQEDEAVFIDEFNRPSKKRRLLRAIFVKSEQDNIVKLGRGKQRPGVLKTTLESNCLIDIPAGSPPLKPGDKVKVLKLPVLYNY